MERGDEEGVERVGRERGGKERVRERMQKGEEEKETCSQHIVHHKLISNNDTIHQ